MLGPADVTISDGVNTIVYAWGSLADDNLALAVQTVDTHASAPTGVPSGQLGLADESGAGSTWLFAGIAAMALAGAALLQRRRSTALEFGSDQR